MYVTVTELARSLSISTAHLAYWVRTERIPSPRQIGAARVYTEAQADKIKHWYAEHLLRKAERRRG